MSSDQERTASKVVLLLALAAWGCAGPEQAGDAGSESPAPAMAALSEALTFHASFDDGVDAAFALGDRRIYTAPSYKEQDAALPGIGNPAVETVAGQGRFGSALKFNKKNEHAIFYRGEKNVAYTPEDWSGTVSFWLNLNPDEDLEPGFCDPIQITDQAYNDAAIWVDFTKDDTPRHFRLGVFGDLNVWNPKEISGNENPDFLNRLVVVKNTPFERGKWTQVTITHAGLGGGSGWAKLYLDGQLQGTTEGISEPFTWDLSRAAIRVGLAYVGLFDDLAIFNRPFSDEEVRTLFNLENGVMSLHP